ncbi:MAG TPA: hypothetical protein VFC90_13410 [Planctomycetota bacterium]|nr:hypothetical protein [Planctomycetota bacterium]
MSEEPARPALSQAETPAAPAPDPVPPATKSSRNIMRAALVFALFGLAVSMWHFLWPSELAFTAFMTIGQGSFGLAIVIYIWMIFRDLRRRKAL